jgi:hypothetical protein
MEGSMTMDNGMDLSPSWQELKAERDGLGRLVHDKAVTIQRMEGEVPRIKAIARAEAMEWAAEKAAPDVAPWLKALARDYRRQAGDE